MGFDPRRWRPAAAARPPVTCNVEALLAENDALRREVRALRLQIERLQMASVPRGPSPTNSRADNGVNSRVNGRPNRGASGRGQDRVTTSTGHGLSSELVERWGTAMARHPHWATLRIGPPGGLRELVEELRRRWWNPQLTLEQELDRRSPGLGAELTEALRGPHSRCRWAVRAAFALYGQRAGEWLNEDPLRVVEELRRRIAQLEQRSPGRGTRTANHTDAQGRDGRQQTAQQHRGSRGQGGAQSDTHHQRRDSSGAGRQQGPTGRSRRSAPDPPAPDPRSQALQLLGLEPGSSQQAIKRAYRRLAKAHHPDLGGDVEAFHRLDAAYRLLIS